MPGNDGISRITDFRIGCHPCVRREAAYLAIVLALAIASTIAIVVMFKQFAGCDLNVAFISITVLACIVLTFMSGASLGWLCGGRHRQLVA